MELKLWHSKKFRKDFDKYFNEYYEKDMLIKQRDFIMEYEQEIIDIKKTIHVIVYLVNILSFLIMLVLLNFGNYKESVVLLILLLFSIWYYRYNKNQIILSSVSMEFTKQIYDEKIKEKYNL